jgi:hypothetical protein
MATVYTTQADKQNSPKPKNMLDGKVLTPNFTVVEVDVTMGGGYDGTGTATGATIATGDTLNLIKLPKGAIINPLYSYVVSNGDVAATSATITVGANADVDALSTALDIDGAGKDVFALFAPVELTSESYVTATFTISGAVTTATVLKFYLAVVLP